VVAGGGFTLMSEAVYLHKPMLSVPVPGQFEQVLNALYLQRLHFGMYAPTLTESALDAFLGNLKASETALRSYGQDGNREAFAGLSELLAQANDSHANRRRRKSA
jgi:UDP-N-acetylglucosamine:LPS N-acetylglucosamine transferase